MPALGAQVKNRPRPADTNRMVVANTWRKREGITMSARGPRRSLFEVRLVALPRVTNFPAALPPARRRATRFDSPDIRQRDTWRKREGIEPPGDISASRPDLKSGRATSAPSASVEDGSPARREKWFISAWGLPSRVSSSTSLSGAYGAGFPASVPSSCALPRFSLAWPAFSSMLAAGTL